VQSDKYIVDDGEVDDEIGEQEREDVG